MIENWVESWKELSLIFCCCRECFHFIINCKIYIKCIKYKFQRTFLWYLLLEERRYSKKASFNRKYMMILSRINFALSSCNTAGVSCFLAWSSGYETYCWTRTTKRAAWPRLALSIRWSIVARAAFSPEQAEQKRDIAALIRAYFGIGRLMACSSRDRPRSQSELQRDIPPRRATPIL